ncbi:MAG: AbrB/MazE/SpoVT family DNA-binding domain-containing protein [Nitrososphaerota archaeon]
MSERVVPIQVTAYNVGNKGKTVVVAIPKPVREMLGITSGTKFVVKTDSKGRIIYKLVKP